MLNRLKGKAADILAALPIVAQALARDAKVSIRIDNAVSMASTDGRTITLPPLPIPVGETTEEMDAATERLAALAYGYIDHEVGHVLYSDFSLLKDLPKVTKWLLYAIEDPRQEVSMIRRYPGCQRSLDRLDDVFIADGRYGVTDAMTPTDLVVQVIHAHLRVILRQQEPFRVIAMAGFDVIERMMGAPVAKSLKELLDQRAPSMKNTHDALALAKDVIAMLAEQTEKCERSEGQGSEGQGSEGQGSEGQGSEGQGSEGQGSEGQGSEGDKRAQFARELRRAMAGDDANGFEDLGDMVRQTLQAAIDAVAGAGPVVYLDDSHMAEAHEEGEDNPRCERLEGHIGGSDIEALSRGGPIDAMAAQRVSASLRRRMKTAIEATRRVSIKVSDKGQQVSDRHLVNVGIADPRVFAHRSPKRAVDTAVVVLVDRSTSMAGLPMKLANEAAYAVALSLVSIKDARCAALAFPSCGPGGAEVIKHFDRQVVLAPDFGCEAGGGTPLAPALYRCARMLERRREQRKLLIVVTDGSPDCRNSAAVALRVIAQRGVECFGVGIQCNAVEGLFNQSKVIDSLAELPATLFGLIQRRLVAA